MKTQILRFGWLVFLVAAVPVGGIGQSLVQLSSLTRGFYNLTGLPEGFFLATRGSQFVESNNLYFTNGTFSGTVQLTQSPVALFTNSQGVPAVIGKIFFFAQADGVYKSDGTTVGTLLVKAGTFNLNASNGLIYKNQLFLKLSGQITCQVFGKLMGPPLVLLK